MLDPLAPRALLGKTVPMPNPEVRERPLRRRFTAEYKRRIVEEASAVSEPGAVGALLRREGLYSSHLVEWRRLYRVGALSGLARPRGRPAPHPLAAENDRLRSAIDRLEARLVRAEKVIAV
jgi:transposase